MPGLNRPLNDEVIIADLMRRVDRHLTGLAVHMPQPKKNSLTITSNGAPATWQLEAIPMRGPDGESCLSLSWNGEEIVEGVDYTVDYTTAIVTFSSGQQALFKATPAPADVLTADYWTTAKLIAATLPADTGAITDTFNRADNTTSLGTTSDGTKTWTVQHGGPMGIQSNQAAAFTNTTSSVATVDSGQSDGSVSVIVPAFTSNTVGGVFRASDGLNFWYVGTTNNGTTGSGLWQRSAGGDTLQLGFSFSAGDTIKATYTGSTITCYVNGTSQGSILHSFNVTATLVGILLLGTTQRVDTFSWTGP